jgi:hypothetical protein
MIELLAVLVLLGILAYLLMEDSLGVMPDPPRAPRGRLCDAYAAGGVFEPLATTLARGARLYEAHIYSDEQDYPVVAKHPQNDGYDYAADNASFEQLCVDILNDAFPSEDPFILSLVLHSDKSIVANRVAEILQTTVRRHLMPPTPDLATRPLDSLQNRLLVVGGGNCRGTNLEPLLTLQWTGESLRRLSYHEASHPRDELELFAFTQNNLAIVAPHPELRLVKTNPNRPKVFGCQWNLFDTTGGGFVEKPDLIRGKKSQ